MWLLTLQLGLGMAFGLTVSIYASGVAWGVIRLAQRLGQRARLMRQLLPTAHASYTLVNTAGQFPVNSFGRWVYWQDAVGAPSPIITFHSSIFFI